MWQTVWKCRLCGEITSRGKPTDELDITSLITFAHDTVTWHTCKNGDAGIVTLAGAQKIKNSQREIPSSE